MKVSRLINKIGSVIPKLALSIGLSTTEQACIWWFHQPKAPAKLEKFKKENR